MNDLDLTSAVPVVRMHVFDLHEVSYVVIEMRRFDHRKLLEVSRSFLLILRILKRFSLPLVVSRLRTSASYIVFHMHVGS